jgi:hypothetical protein
LDSEIKGRKGKVNSMSPLVESSEEPCFEASDLDTSTFETTFLKNVFNSYSHNNNDERENEMQ